MKNEKDSYQFSYLHKKPYQFNNDNKNDVWAKNITGACYKRIEEVSCDWRSEYKDRRMRFEIRIGLLSGIYNLSIIDC